MERERFRVGRVSFYREALAWSIDLTWRGVRVRKSLGKDPRLVAAAVQAAMEGDPERLLRADGTPVFGTGGFKGPIWEVPVRPAREIISGSETGELPQIVEVPVRTGQDVLDEILDKSFEKNFSRVLGGPPKPVLVCEAIPEYRKYLLDGKDDDAKHVDNVVGQLHMFFRDAQVEFVHETQPQMIIKYLASGKLKEGWTPKTRKDKRGHISAFFRWAMKIAKYIRENPAEEVPVPTIRSAPPRYLSLKEILPLLRALRSRISHVQRVIQWIITIGLYTGMRLSEILRLEGERIDIKRRVITVPIGKTGYRNLRLFDQVLAIFKRLHRPGRIFERSKSGSFGRQVRAVFRKAGIKDHEYFRLTRRTWITHLRMAGVEQHTLTGWAGHGKEVERKSYEGFAVDDKPLLMTLFGRRLDKNGDPTGRKIRTPKDR